MKKLGKPLDFFHLYYIFILTLTNVSVPTLKWVQNHQGDKGIGTIINKKLKI